MTTLRFMVLKFPVDFVKILSFDVVRFFIGIAGGDETLDLYPFQGEDRFRILNKYEGRGEDAGTKAELFSLQKVPFQRQPTAMSTSRCFL